MHREIPRGTPRARIVPGPEAAHARPLDRPRVTASRARRIARVEVEAHFAADQLLRAARSRADEIVAEARTEASVVALAAASEARQQAGADLTVKWLALRTEEQRWLSGSVEAIVPLAVALAERLVGASLELGPERIGSLARAVIDEARGARRVVIDAHPEDADPLRHHLTADTGDLGLPPVEVRPDPSLARGELRLHTDRGTIDARLAPRLERLATALRDALRAPASQRTGRS